MLINRQLCSLVSEQATYNCIVLHIYNTYQRVINCTQCLNVLLAMIKWLMLSVRVSFA